MKVLLSGLWAAQQPSGICRSVINLVRGLNEASPETEIVLAIGAWQRQYFEESLHLGDLDVQVIEIEIPNRPIRRNAWYLKELPALAQKVRADVVHFAFPAPIWRRAFSCPVVVTLHDLYPYDRPDNFGYPRVFLNRLALRQSLHDADSIVCVSQFTLQHLRTLFPHFAGRATCIPHATHVVADPKTSSMPGPFVLAVAQHRANKNLDLLISVYDRCRNLRVLARETKLIVVGAKGPESAKLHALVERLCVKQDVFFLSQRTDYQMASLYRGCCLFVSLADIEGYGLPLAEALAYGARVVASDIPTHREVAGDRCEYVDLSRGTASILAGVGAALRRPRPAALPANDSIRNFGEKHQAAYHAVIEQQSMHRSRARTLAAKSPLEAK